MTSLDECQLFKAPQRVLARPLQEHFVQLRVFTKSSHFWRYLLLCRCCEIQYFYEFHEQIDWLSGEDPQFSTFIPVSGEQEAVQLCRLKPRDFEDVRPRLCKDFPKAAKAPHIHWVT